MTETLRCVLFDVPGEADLLGALHAASPNAAFRRCARWDADARDARDAVSVWHWTASEEAFAEKAGEILRRLVYPLVASGAPFVVAFSFGRELLLPVSLGLRDTGYLDLEDIGRLLLDNAADTTFELLPQLHDRLALTPIEQQIAHALTEVGVKATPQVKLGAYRADFLVEHRGQQFVVEADGRGYHDPQADAVRDAALAARGVQKVIRFTGSQIYRAPLVCAEEVRRIVNGAAPRLDAKIDDSLDASQRRAAEHRAGAARVLAPAGAGKTKTMVARVLELLRRGVPPGSILVLAFNKKAAEQLNHRLGQLGVPLTRDLVPFTNGVLCATFNAFGYRYQTQMLGRRPKMEPEEKVWRGMMTSALEDSGYPLGSLRSVPGSDPLGRFLKALDRTKADLQPPQQVEVEIESFSDQGNRVIPFAPVFEAFQKRQLAAGIDTFDDQLFVTLRDLMQSPERRRALQCRFEHILVDEFQDLNEAQLALVDILSRPYRNLFVVGDDDQLIYGWRFAKPGNILDFHDRVPPKPYSATYTLSTNYRCCRTVVEASRRVIDRNRFREPKNFHARQGAPAGAVRYFASASWAARADQIVRFLQTEKARLDCKWQHLAVLCRFKAQQAPLAMALDVAGIPRSPLLRYRLYTQSAALLLRAYLTLVLQPESVPGEVLDMVLNRPNRYIKKADVATIARADRPWQALREWRDAQHLAPRSVAAFIRATEELHQQAERLSASELLESVIREFDLERFWSDGLQQARGMEQDDGGPLQVVSLLRMIAEDIPDSAAFLAQWDATAEKERSGDDVREDDLEREESEHQDHVVIGTIHSAKGREYQAVVLVDYDPDISRVTDAELEEERRVLYVGLTRAQQSLLLTVDERRPLNSLLAEAILPRRTPDEEESTQRAIARSRSSAVECVAMLERHRAALRAVVDGTEAEELSRTAEGLRSQIASREQSLRKLRERFAEVGGEGEAAIDLATKRDVEDALRDARASLSSLGSGEEALRREQAAARDRGGWWPTKGEQEARWEAEIDRHRQRTYELDLQIDRIRTEQNVGGFGAAMARFSGKSARLERERTHVERERDSISDRMKAMQQARGIADELERRSAERRASQRAIDQLEKQAALLATYSATREERGSLVTRLSTVEDRLSVLRTRPDLLRAELQEKVRAAEQQLAQVETDQAALEGRLQELALLAGRS